MITTTLWLLSAAHAQPVLTVSGACPGPIDVQLEGLTPSGAWALLGGPVGSTVVQGGPCAGLQTGLASPRVVATARADGAGSAQLGPNAPAAACSLSLQAVDATTCLPSAVVPVAGADPLADLGDEFDDSASFGDWFVRHLEEGDPPHHDTLDIDTTTPGHLVIDPNLYDDPLLNDGGQGPAWFQDRKGPLLYKEVTGDFVVQVHVRVGTVADMDATPQGSFIAGGLLARDPASAAADLGDEAWLMYNIGQQAGFVASETKTTFPDNADADAESQSSLFLTPVSGLSGVLSMCRLGDEFRFFRRLDGDAGWTEETQTADNLYNNSANLPGVDYHAEGFVRTDLPDTIQVGALGGRWSSGGGSPPRMEFDWIRFATPRSAADCATLIPAP